MLADVRDRVLDWMFRPQCAACGAPAQALCDGCRGSLVEIGPACPRCGEPRADEETALRTVSVASIASRDARLSGKEGASPEAEADAVCARCRRHPLPLAGVIAPWRFGGQLASAIRRLKFTGHAHIARDLAPLWAPALAAAVRARDAIVVAVPLHWRRRARRGYDHAWLLAHHACAAVGLAPPVCALRRVRHGPAQSTLPALLRAANVHGAFALTRAAARGGWVAGRAIVLVDDVMTTGATLTAAARPLLAAGAAQVTALVVARATSARE